MNARKAFYDWYRVARCGATNWPRYDHPEKAIAQSALACKRVRDFGVERSSRWYGHAPKLP